MLYIYYRKKKVQLEVWNTFNNVTKKMLVLYKICYIYIYTYIYVYIYIYIAARNKCNWNAFNDVTKKMLVLYKICYIYIAARKKCNWNVFSNLTIIFSNIYIYIKNPTTKKVGHSVQKWGIATTVFQNVGALRLRGWGIATLKLGHCD